MKILEWTMSLVAAIILLQTLYFKFTGQPESIYIFTKVGMEPWGRYGSGLAELIGGIALLVPRYRVYGAVIGLAVISGAIFFHLTKLGIEIHGDGGLLFYYAIAVFVCCLFIVVMRRRDLPFFR